MCTVPITVVTSCFGAVHRVSVVLYWTGEYRKYQILACSDWIGGLYGSPIMGGTKPGNEWDWESLSPPTPHSLSTLSPPPLSNSFSFSSVPQFF